MDEQTPRAIARLPPQHPVGEPLQIGLPFPSLALEYLLSSNVLHLGGIYGIAGPPKSFKSALALELSRIVVAHGGTNGYCETEGGRISPVIIESIYGELIERLLMRSVVNVEHAQLFLTSVIDYVHKRCPDRDELFGLVLDSLYGCASERQHEAMIKAGHASRGYPSEAWLWDTWFRNNADRLLGWPMVMIFTNHLKQRLGASYSGEHDATRHPGGGNQDFYATAYMHISRGRCNEDARWVVHHLSIMAVRVRCGPEYRSIDVPFVVDKTRATPMHFDWGHATAHLLAEDGEPKSYQAARRRMPPVRRRPDVMAVLEVTSNSHSMLAPRRTFSCTRLGLVGVSGAALGAAVHADAQLMEELRDALGVRRHRIWDGAMPRGRTRVVEVESPPLDDEDDGQNELWLGVLGDHRQPRRRRRRRRREDGEAR